MMLSILTILLSPSSASLVCNLFAIGTLYNDTTTRKFYIMSASAMATKRLRKELVALQTDPPPGLIAEPDEGNILIWYYALVGPADTAYQGGVYVGKLRFPPTYPMAPPAVMMLTPSGRFQVNTRLCLSMR